MTTCDFLDRPDRRPLGFQGSQTSDIRASRAGLRGTLVSFSETGALTHSALHGVYICKGRPDPTFRRLGGFQDDLCNPLKAFSPTR